MTVTINQGPASTAQAYIDEQNLHKMLSAALNQLMSERAEKGITRLAEILQQSALAQDEENRMHELFQMAAKGKGTIGMDELRTFCEIMGQPLDEVQLQVAFDEMNAQDRNGQINFAAFAKWYKTATVKGGALHRKGAIAVETKSRASRASRASRRVSVDSSSSLVPVADALANGFDLNGCEVRAVGEPQTLQYRVQLHYGQGSDGVKQISPWHDVPLYPVGSNKEKGVVHMVVEIPKWSRDKFEIATGEELNPIKQDTKKGKLRAYTYGDMLFNYGCFPQTWEDPTHTSPDTNAIGDNDPIDAMEIGTQILPTGSVVRVKVLGCLAMIDDGETDWKVLCIRCDDPLAEHLNDIDDVERLIPGLIGVAREWLRLYKTTDGKPKNEFGLSERAMDKAYTMNIVEETHVFWQQLIGRGLLTV